MLMTLIQKEITAPYFEHPVCRASVDVCFAHPAYPFYQLS